MADKVRAKLHDIIASKLLLFLLLLLLLSLLRAVSPAHTNTLAQQLPLSACIVHLNSNLYLPHSTMRKRERKGQRRGERESRTAEPGDMVNTLPANGQEFGQVASLERVYVCVWALASEKETQIKPRAQNRVSLKLEKGRVRAICCHCCLAI